MIRKFILGVVIGVVLALGVNKAFSDENILFEKKNTVVLREEFTESTVDAIKARLIAVSQALPANEPIYLYLDTPGGEVGAGQYLITVMKGIKNPIHVVAHFAASMGYLTTQAATGKRYVTDDGILMAHRATLGVQGQTPGQISARLAFFEKVTNDLAAMAAKRTGITTQAYQDKVRDEYWVQGSAAVKNNQADAVANVSCSSDLAGTYSEVLLTMFGPIDIEWANCPLISGPVSVSFSRAELNGYSPIEFYNFQQTVNAILTHPKLDIVDDSNLLTNYHHWVK